MLLRATRCSVQPSVYARHYAKDLRREVGREHFKTPKRDLPAPITERPNVTSSMLITTEQIPPVYEDDAELYQDIKSMIQALVPLKTLKAMRNQLQPRARVKWDRYIEFAESQAEGMEDRLTDILGKPEISRVKDLDEDRFFYGWKDALQQFLVASNVAEREDTIGNDWTWRGASRAGTKAWHAFEYTLISADETTSHDPTSTVTQERRKYEQEDLFIEGTAEQAELFNQIIHDKFMEKYRVAEEIKKDFEAGKPLPPALQARLDAMKKKILPSLKVGSSKSAQRELLIPISSLTQQEKDKWQDYIDVYPIKTAIKNAEKSEGTKALVPFLKLIRISIEKKEDTGETVSLIQDLLNQIPQLERFLETRALIPDIDATNIPGITQFIENLDAETVESPFTLTVDEATRWATLYDENRKKEKINRMIEEFEVEEMEEGIEDGDSEHQDTETDGPSHHDDPLKTLEDRDFKNPIDYFNGHRERVYNHDRVVIISWTLKSMFLSEVLDLQKATDRNEESNTRLHTVRTIDIPPRWLLAFKRLEWPQQRTLDDYYMILTKHAPTQQVKEGEMAPAAQFQKE